MKLKADIVFGAPFSPGMNVWNMWMCEALLLEIQSAHFPWISKEHPIEHFFKHASGNLHAEKSRKKCKCSKKKKKHHMSLLYSQPKYNKVLNF